MSVRQPHSNGAVDTGTGGSLEVHAVLEEELKKAQLRGDLSVLAVGGCSGAGEQESDFRGNKLGAFSKGML